jgi:hypothetical protein
VAVNKLDINCLVRVAAIEKFLAQVQRVGGVNDKAYLVIRQNLTQ